MKTWNEIEQRLKTENRRDELPAGLHDQIMRTVRDHRAAASSAERPHHYAAYWLMGGALGMAVLAMTSILFLPPFGSVQPSEAPAAPNISLASLEDYATAPMQTEVQALRNDLNAAASFLASYIPNPATDG